MDKIMLNFKFHVDKLQQLCLLAVNNDLMYNFYIYPDIYEGGYELVIIEHSGVMVDKMSFGYIEEAINCAKESVRTCLIKKGGRGDNAKEGY